MASSGRKLPNDKAVRQAREETMLLMSLYKGGFLELRDGRQMDKVEHVFIVGAGFSHPAGLPLASGVTERLLDTDGLRGNGPSALQAEFLRTFVSDVFSHAPNAGATSWPQLEDVFTCVDLSANSGHHLGQKYAPSDLRTVRRALITRIIRMLQQAYHRKKKNPDPEWCDLEKFFSMVDPAKSAFLSMNWDTVIEDGLKRTQKISYYDYGCEALAASFLQKSSSIRVSDETEIKSIRIIKPHGSVNWLYCDACRETFWFSSISALRIAAQLFRESDWNVVNKFIRKNYQFPVKSYKCPRCETQGLGTRFATFSYRKALDFPMHESSWKSAERLLKDAKTWTFIGYSMPGADFEFKHLLKRVELCRALPPRIVLITGGDEVAASDTVSNYKKFFGKSLTNVYKQGIGDSSISGLKKLGIL